MKKTFPLHKIYFSIVFLFFSALFLAQQKPSDTANISIRKDYALPNPTRYEAFYDVKTGMYYLYPKIGNTVTGAPIVLTPKEYSTYTLNNSLKDYYQQKAFGGNLYKEDKKEAEKKGLIQSVTIKNKIFETIFGSNKIELIPNGFASFDLGGLHQKIENPLILPQNRSNFAINIQQRIQLGVLGKVGENLQLKANYDTQSGFAFENRMNLVWQAKGTWRDLQNQAIGEAKNPLKGGEDKIIKRVEFGNVNMPLSTNLIRGSESLFGLKTEFQLGKTYGTLVFSQQQGEARNIVVQGGGVMQTFKINAYDYEDNQHYFLGQYFLNNYDNALANYPLINSRISITRLELWVLDQGSGNLQEQKSILGIRDLGEGGSFPDNSNLGVYNAVANLGGIRDVNQTYNAINNQSLPNTTGDPSYKDGEHFIFNRKAKRLNPAEYTFNPQVGYISLNQRLNDNQLLAASFSYTVSGDSKVYKVGEFSEESPVVITKLLKPNVSVKTTSPMWNLMMKNVYSLNANQIDSQNFLLNVLYRDNDSGGKVNYLPGTPVADQNLLKLFNWDRLNVNNDIQNNTNGQQGDGLFDFVQGITVDAQNGRVMFTKAQPFGSYLESVLGSNDPKFVFNELYTQQKQVASENNLALRYTIEGRYKGSQGTGISLGAINVPRGSVKVTANGVVLTEGVDYTVDYMLGQVTIINEMVKQSGQAINVSLENQLTFNTQRKRFLGLNLERKFNENLTIGATVVNYSETPLTQKVQTGFEAVNNTMAGFNLMYNNQSQFLTRLTDKIPFINTEAPSNINLKLEGAYLIPGQNKGINDESYIDDFEQTTSKISLKEPAVWSLASKPEIGFGSSNNNDLTNGYGRGLLSWYNIDPRFYGVGGKAPNGINAEALSNHASRRVQMIELFNNRDFVAGEQTFTNTFDITYYPKERGPYNLNQNAEIPSQRWAGLMRPITVSNFRSSNIEYVEFWMMDPYADGKMLGTAPKLMLQLGNVSEDILKDGKLQYENGLPTPNTPAKTSSTNWGTQPDQFPVLYAFGTENEERTAQDVGFDGLDNVAEATAFNTNFINPVKNEPDPAADDFVFYLSNQFQGALASSMIERYKYFRNPDGNSQSNSLEVSSQTPDAEDVNKDYNLDQSENYNQYDINLAQSELVLGRNNIVDVKEVEVKFQNGQTSKNKWFLFRIPVANYNSSTETSGADQILNNVRFARMMLTGFDETATIRFGTLDLVRSEWRKYGKGIASNRVDDQNQFEGTGTIDNSKFDVGSVNLEENALGTPPYVLPPGIERQVLSGNAGAQRQNEASLYMKTDLPNGEARGVFKNIALDMRRFQNLELFVHAEDLIGKGSNLDKSAKFFIRFGSDATDNYYEYEASLKYTAPNATSPLDIWPNENTVRLAIQDFVDLKILRDKNSTVTNERFTSADFGDENKAFYVKGRPSLGNITTMMIGVRNNDEVDKNLILWVNEIRLSGIENKGGYAGNANLNFNLGDFATVNASGAYSTIGFGFINQKPAERSQTTNSAFGINTIVNVDKFLPEKLGLKIPVNYSYSQTIEDPKYNPLNDDVEFKKDPKKDELKKVARTYTQQRSIGVLNMRKDRMNPNKKPKFYDVENLSISLIYNDDKYRDVYTKDNYRQYLRGNIDYSFNFKPWNLKPFNKIVSDTAKSYPYLKWAKEINFNIVPTRVSFRTELDRNYNELEFRNIDALLNGNSSADFDVIKNRNFFFGWQYNVGFNLTKSLKLDISSATRTINDQLDIQTFDRSSIFQNVFQKGRPVLYNHRIQLSYRLPFENLPYLDFVNTEIGYGVQYNWSARSTAMVDTNGVKLGNLAQNTNNINVTGGADFNSFFNKFKYFRKVNDKMNARKSEIDSLNNVYTQNFLKKGRKKAFKSYTFKNKLTPTQAFAYALTAIKQLDFNYTENNGTVLPGLLSSPNFYGYGKGIGGPTFGFLLGSQADIRRYAIENSWISSSEYMTEAYSQMTTRNLTGNIQIQPINDFRIDVSFTKNYMKNLMHGNFNVDAISSTPQFDFSFASEMITFTNSNILLKTSFGSDNIYEKIIENAKTISQMYGTPQADGYAEHYSKANAYVLIPAFQAAIEGKSPTKNNNLEKSKFPMPNWRITYSGIKNIPFINSQFAKFDILHAYTSTYTATGIQKSVDYYNKNVNPGAPQYDINNDVYNPYTFNTIGYVEDFSPLLGADVTMRNNMQFRLQYNKNRMYTLGLVNHTLTEDLGSEYVFGFGYILKDLKIKVRYQGKEKNLKSDLNVRADFSLRDNQTRITNILLDDSQITGGQRLMSVKVSADYNISQNFNLRFFYDQLMTKYKISTAFPLSTVRAGITATFNFGGGQGF